MMGMPGGDAPRPQNICEVCGEYLPHACAATVTITDRPTRRPTA